MNKNKHEKIIYVLYIIAVIPVIIIPAVVYIVSSNILAAVLCFTATAILYVLMLFIHYIDNLYITKIISALMALAVILCLATSAFSKNHFRLIKAYG